MGTALWDCARAQVDLHGGNATFTNLTGITGITNTGGGAPRVFAYTNASTVYAGVIQDGNGVTALTVYGTASLTLSGQNTFSGGTQAGYLLGIPQSGSLYIGSGGQIGDVSVLYGSSLTNMNGGAIGFGASTNNLPGTSGNVSIDATSSFTNSGIVNGTVHNAGAFTNSSGGIVAGVTNAGSFDNQFNATVTGGLANNAAALATNEGNITGGVIVNGGTFTTTGTVSNGATNSALINMGKVNAAGAINGPIQNIGGTFTITGGNLSGDGATTSFTNSGNAALFVTGGNFSGLTTITNTSTYSDANGGGIQIGAGKLLSAESLANGASTGNRVTITDAGNFMLSGNLTNYATGVINVIGTGSLTAASFTNWGIINITPGASATFNGNLFNNSVINMQNGSPTDVTTVNGNYTGNGGLRVDINTVTDQSDRLVVNGAALSTNGTTTVSFNVLASGFAVALPVVLTNGTDARAFSGSIPDWGTISYSFGRDPNNPNNWVVRSYLNHGFGPLADISGALASIATVFQQPASSYVGDKSGAKVDELFCGTWARTDIDRLTVHSSSTVTAKGAPVAPLSTSQNLNYTAVESGLDCGLLRLGATGWNAHLGLIGGVIDGQVNQTDGLGYTGLHVPILGGYAFIRNGGFVFDLSLRKSFTDAEFTIAQAGLRKAPVEGVATTAAAYTSYTFQLQNNLLLMPYTGLSWTRSDLSDFDIYSIGGIYTGRVAPNTNEDSIGRLGFQLSYVRQLADTFYLRPFAGMSAWHAFENGTSLKYYVPDGTVVNVTTPTPKDFMQVEGGLSFAENSIQATGYVKGVYKEGSEIRGESIVLGARLNF